MYFCTNCNGHRIKTRTNTLFGKKTVVTGVRCKDCGSTSLEQREERKGRYRKK